MPSEQSYYLSLEAEDNNVRSVDRGLIINCTGMCVLTQPFENYTKLGREDYYLQYLVKGEMRVWLPEGEQQMHPGQAILYYPHTGYHYAMHGREEVQYYWIHFTGADAQVLMEQCRLSNHCLMTVGSSASVESDFEGLFHDFMMRDHCFDFSSAAKLVSICTELSRRLDSAQNGCSGATHRIYHALSYIHQNYEKSITVQLLADLENLSPSRFRFLFREATGLSPLDYLTVLRLNQARLLMMQTERSIGEIAEVVGFADQLYFSRIFKKRTGLSPSAYRSRLQESSHGK